MSVHSWWSRLRKRSTSSESADAIKWEADHEQVLLGEHLAEGEIVMPLERGEMDLDVAEREEDSYKGD